MLQTKIKFALAFISLFLSVSILALPSDGQQEIHITSDSAFLDKQQGRLVYSGNVEMKQGSLSIQADRITLVRTELGLQKVIALGKPAHYEQVLSVAGGKTQAYGETIIYSTQNEELTLLVNAGLKKQGNLFSGEKIVYLIKEQRVKADSHSQDGRIHMVIQPKKKPTEAPDKNKESK